jgi:hypothetical protein
MTVECVHLHVLDATTNPMGGWVVNQVGGEALTERAKTISRPVR